ncbi:MAG TPA: methyltransferase domain-containing protein [Aliidongia sp.]|nr:methyltransferase domain-containing protein [Aliidongia sp.]
MNVNINLAPHLGALWRGTGGEVAHRLRAWWYGFDLRSQAPPPEPEPEPAPDAVDTEPLDRLVLAQRLWGPGFLTPGGTDQIMHLIKLFNVNPAMSLLDLSAGLGGPSRHVSQTFDVYITGLERQPDVAKRGNKASVDAGLARKVPITAYDPETTELRAHAFDAVYAQHLTATVGNKDRLFGEVLRSLKPRGQFSFIDLVQLDGDASDPRLEALRRIERQPFLPWRVQQYVDCLTNIGFDCRISEDETTMYKAQVVRGWEQFLMAQDLKAMPKHHVQVVLEEAELWVGRLQAIQSGLLGVCRFYAVSTQRGVK